MFLGHSGAPPGVPRTIIITADAPLLACVEEFSFLPKEYANGEIDKGFLPSNYFWDTAPHLLKIN
jgi:hypothetical protein